MAETRTEADWLRRAAWIAVIALVVRVLLTLLVVDMHPYKDELAYIRSARQLLEGQPYTEVFRAPLYPALLAAAKGIFGTLTPVRFIQAGLGVVSAVLVGGVARTLVGNRGAFIAVGLVAFDPVLVFFGQCYWSETVFLTAFWTVMYCVVSDPEFERPGLWGVAGLALGVAGLTRPMILTWAPLLVAVVLVHAYRRQLHGNALRRVAILTVATCLVVLPWTARNLKETGHFILVDTNGAFNLLVSTEDEARFVDKDDRWSPKWGSLGTAHYVAASRKDPGRAQKEASKLAMERIAADPVTYLRKSIWEGQHFWTLDSFLLRHLRNDWYASRAATRHSGLITVFTAGWSAVLIGLGLFGLLTAKKSTLRSLAWLTIGHSAVLFALVYSLSRYQVPLRPFFALGIVLLITRLQDPDPDRKRSWMPIVFWVALMLFIGVGWWRDAPLLLDMIQTGGVNFRFNTP